MSVRVGSNTLLHSRDNGLALFTIIQALPPSRSHQQASHVAMVSAKLTQRGAVSSAAFSHCLTSRVLTRVLANNDAMYMDINTAHFVHSPNVNTIDHTSEGLAHGHALGKGSPAVSTAAFLYCFSSRVLTHVFAKHEVMYLDIVTAYSGRVVEH